MTIRLAWAAAVLVAVVACGDADGTPTSEATTEPSVEARVAADGDAVAVHYVGTLDDGSEFDSSAGRAPLEFVVGSGQVISGFDAAVRGLAVGESRTVRMEPEDAYGQYDPSLMVTVSIDRAPPGLEVGQQVQAQGRVATVTEVTAEAVTVDANHPLAGEALTFAVELVSIG